jgi:hypothetical protein
MVSSIQNSINSVIYSASSADTLSTSATTSLLQSSYEPFIPEDLVVTNSDGSTLSLETLLATNIAANSDASIFSSLTSSTSFGDLLSTSYNTASSLETTLAASFGAEGTDLDLLV